MSLQLRIVNPPGIADVVTRCVSGEFEIRDREGRTGRGFTNLKRILGRPADFAFVVDQLARNTLRAAREALNLVGLDGRTASALLWTYRADLAKDELSAVGITMVTSLVHQSQIPD